MTFESHVCDGCWCGGGDLVSMVAEMMMMGRFPMYFNHEVYNAPYAAVSADGIWSEYGVN